ncbi:MAG TPA: abortive phage infection protein, partial [Clostridiales bacterium]|nr:abortive phage infection protein [Clostridiales bacterium]
DNFKRILGQLTLDNVRIAIQQSKAIMQRNQESGYTLRQYKSYRYYRENPALSIWESIEKILKECKLL